MQEVCRVLVADKLENDKGFSYLFYRRGEKTVEYSGEIDDAGEFCKGLADACLEK